MERLMKKQIWRRAARFSQWFGLLLLIGWLAAGCQATGENPPFSPVPVDVFPSPAADTVKTNVPGGLAAIAQNADRLAIGDLVTVKFSGIVEPIPPHEERITEDGTITLPLIGAVVATGKTLGELQKEIHDRYVPDYYKRLTPVVTGEQRVYSVGGQVKSPGRQSYIGATTVTKAIQSAGDFTDFAARRRVVLTRADGKRFIIDCKKAAKDPALDLPVYPGDKIEVDQRGILDTFD
jgi:protein involved in polysaccharide export with SLBB domain